MLSNLVIPAAAALLASSTAMAAPASPLSPRTFAVAVGTPSVTTADGTYDAKLAERNLKQTFAKLEGFVEGVEAKAKARMQKKAKNSGATIELEGGYYAAPILVGTPAQQARVVVDTGSSDVWVYGGTDAFESNKSSTLTSTGETVDFSYVTGAYTADLVSDTVSLGGLTVPNQYFGVVPLPEEVDPEDPLAGVGTIGLSFQDIAKIDHPTFFQNLLSHKQISSPQFGLYLSRDPSTSASELTLGGSSVKHYKGSMTKYSVVEGFGRWTLKLKHLLVSGKKVADPQTYTFIDSGSSVSYLPKEVVAALYAAIPGSKRFYGGPESATLNGVEYTLDAYQFPCNTAARPEYVFDGGYRRPLAVDPAGMSLGPANEAGDMCIGSVIGVDITYGGATCGLLGVDFLKNVYSVFDFGSNGASPSIAFGIVKP
ncbi:hypothetical protein JCM10213_002703 [Rhodosporidiobolus nylandii]